MAEKGITVLYTGDGKGKTTAAMGAAARALGNGARVMIICFLKSEEFASGEYSLMRRNGAEVYVGGEGFLWEKTAEIHKNALESAVTCMKIALKDDGLDLLILDEINCVLNSGIEDGIISESSLIAELEARAGGMHVILTGRNAPESLIEFADIATEMKKIKHIYDIGGTAVKNIDF